MLKICTIAGCRPEWIRLSRVIPKLDRLCNHILVHTEQNYDECLNQSILNDLGLRAPNYYLGARGTLGEQLGVIFPKIEKIFKKERPDKVLILGDTNSSLAAIVAERMEIPVFHAESSNRSYNKKIPEEVNRKLVDSISTHNLFYTPLNRHTLLGEGINPKNIFMCGNPTLEVIKYYKRNIESSQILQKLDINKHQYFLVDIHRAENVDSEENFSEIFSSLNYIASQLGLPIICSMHPRTRKKWEESALKYHSKIKFLDAMGFFDFQKLEKNALVGLTDSGLCSEEYCLYQVPCVIVRNETERPEVVEAGGAIVSGIHSTRIVECTKLMKDLVGSSWDLPIGYSDLNVSNKIVNYILGNN